jgi:hypothetical protein
MEGGRDDEGGRHQVAVSTGLSRRTNIAEFKSSTCTPDEILSRPDRPCANFLRFQENLILPVVFQLLPLQLLCKMARVASFRNQPLTISQPRINLFERMPQLYTHLQMHHGSNSDMHIVVAIQGGRRCGES